MSKQSFLLILFTW